MKIDNLAIGEFSVLELLKHHKDVVIKIYVKDKKEREKYLPYFNKIEINKNYIDKIVKKEDIYALAIFKPYTMKLSKDIHILIYDINDEGEIGTIIRTAVAFDYKNIVLINSNIDIFSSKLIRASTGAFFIANINKYKNEEEYLKDYPNNKTLKIKIKGATPSLDAALLLYKNAD